MEAEYLNIEIWWDWDVPRLGDLWQGPDAVLHVETLIQCQPGALGDPERGSQELSKNWLSGLEKIQSKWNFWNYMYFQPHIFLRN